MRAGEPLWLVYADPNGRVLPALRLGPGRPLRLSPALLASPRPDRGAGAAAWDSVVWPWGAAARTEVAFEASLDADSPAPVARFEPVVARPVPAPPVTSPRFHSPPVAPPVVRHLTPDTQSVEPNARALGAPPSFDTPPPHASSPTGSAPRAPRPDEPRASAPATAAHGSTLSAPEPNHDTGTTHDMRPTNDIPPAAESVSQPPIGAPTGARYVVADWRGLARDELERLPFGVVQRSAHLWWTQLDDRHWRLILDEAAGRSIWLFGHSRDVRLAPGVSITLNDKGRLEGFQGPIRVLPAPLDRPRFDDLAPDGR